MITLELATTIPWNRFKTSADAASWATKATVSLLEKAVTDAKDDYYNGDGKNPLCTDAVYDEIEDALRARKPNSKALQIGAKPQNIELKKVPLPAHMGSLDKVKDEDVLVRWLKKMDTDLFVAMDKLDGISFLHTKIGTEEKLYKRGDGGEGTDISVFIPYIKSLPAAKQGVLVRGELIMAKAKFDKIWSDTFKNPRNLVGGITNRKDIHDAFRDVRAVAYEMIGYQPETGLQYLKASGYEAVEYTVFKKAPTFNDLVALHNERKAKSKYEIDGIVVTRNLKNPINRSGNPDYSVAFKINDEANAPQVKVLEVVWRESRLGYLTPRVIIEPTPMQGVTVNAASGHNARFIVEKRIGPGAIVRVLRSGEVIPKVVGVVKPARKPSMPTADYIWASDAEIKLVNASNEVDIRRAEHFFERLGVERFKYASVKKFFDAGMDLIQILHANEKTYERLLGKTGLDVNAQIDDIFDDGVRLDVLLDASGLFDGIGRSRFNALVTAMPDLMTMKKPDVVAGLSAIPGWGQTFADDFISVFPEFRKFFKLTGLDYVVPKPKKIVTKGVLAGQVVLFTGFRDADLGEAVERAAGVLATSMSSKVTILVARGTNNKTEAAQAKGITVLTPDEFRSRYKL